MVGTLLVVVLVLAIGTRVTDGVRLRQQEAILAKLPEGEAVAFYRVLQRRVWKVRVLRAITLLSLLALLHARNRAQRHAAGPASPSHQTAPALPPQGAGGSG